MSHPYNSFFDVFIGDDKIKMFNFTLLTIKFEAKCISEPLAIL